MSVWYNKTIMASKQVTLYNYSLWNRLLSGFIKLNKCNIHRAAGEVNIGFERLINQMATYSKVNDCFISWKCVIVIYLQIHCHTNKISQFWSVCLWLSRKTNVKCNLIGKKSGFFHHLCLCLARVISLSGYLPGSIFSREGDIASTQNLLISIKAIICKLNYSHVITIIINLRNVEKTTL